MSLGPKLSRKREYTTYLTILRGPQKMRKSDALLQQQQEEKQQEQAQTQAQEQDNKKNMNKNKNKNKSGLEQFGTTKLHKS